MFTLNDMDSVFQALAHASRRQILDIVKSSPGCSVGKLASYFDVSRIAVMNHIGILEKANLLTSEKCGRTRHLYINAAPLQMIHERWTNEYSAYWAEHMIDIKHAAETKHKSNKGK